MVLTQQKDTAQYLASLEAAYRPTEVQLFGNITNTCVAWTSVPGYQNLNRTTITNPNDSVSKVDYNGTSGQKTGPSLLLKVMSGDTIKLAVQSYYNSGSGATNNSSFNDVLNSLASMLVNATGGGHGTVANLTASGSTVYWAVNSFLSADEATPTGYPKAYLNWIFLNDQFNYDSSLSGAIPAASSTYPAGTLNPVAPGSPLNITKNGYLYIWVSNETQGWDVFFDNLSVQHRQGPILEESHYYPFGLTMAGLSDKAIKPSYAENKYRYNGGNELQNREFGDGTGLELYDAVHRMYDPQIGRFGQIDPLSDVGLSFSPFNFASNNPVSRNDPYGLKDTLAMGQIAQRDRDLASVTITAKHTTKNLINTYWDLVNRGVNLNRVKDKGLRNWLLNYDDTQLWLHKLHLEQRSEEQTWLEYGSWLIPIPVGEIRIAGKLGSVALKLLGRGGNEILAEGGSHLVYQGIDPATGLVKYVGITGRSLSEREAEHLAATGTGKELLDYRVVDGATGLTKQEARVIEQKLINQYGLQKDGGQLLNKINSIAEKYWGVNGITK